MTGMIIFVLAWIGFEIGYKLGKKDERKRHFIEDRCRIQEASR
jgi:hypothetical protein